MNAAKLRDGQSLEILLPSDTFEIKIGIKIIETKARRKDAIGSDSIY
jgi:hypothetical protein